MEKNMDKKYFPFTMQSQKIRKLIGQELEIEISVRKFDSLLISAFNRALTLPIILLNPIGEIIGLIILTINF
jgi:hypothetical protein